MKYERMIRTKRMNNTKQIFEGKGEVKQQHEKNSRKKRMSGSTWVQRDTRGLRCRNPKEQRHGVPKTMAVQ